MYTHVHKFFIYLPNESAIVRVGKWRSKTPHQICIINTRTKGNYLARYIKNHLIFHKPRFHPTRLKTAPVNGDRPITGPDMDIYCEQVKTVSHAEIYCWNCESFRIVELKIPLQIWWVEFGAHGLNRIVLARFHSFLRLYKLFKLVVAIAVYWVIQNIPTKM